MNLKKLREFPKNKALIVVTIISFIAFLLLTLIMAPTELYLERNTGYGVLDFEFAWTSEKINRIFNAWGSSGKQMELITTYIDFLYIVCYAFCYSGCILLITRKLKDRAQKIGLYVALTPFIAGIFDVIENINLILMLTNDSFIRGGSPFIASLCATFKFGFLIVGWVFIVVGFLVLLINKFKK